MINPQIASKKVTNHILKAFNLKASKRFGQNFLIDAGVVAGIVDAAEIKEGDRVLEIGPGIGTLSQGLLEAGAHVTAVEIDKKLPAVLAETLKGYENFTLAQGDILKTNLRQLMGGEPFKVVANLPYYITTPIILMLLEAKLPITHIVAMVQQEVAERMTASAGGRDYGALSVAVQYFTEPEIVMPVPPKSFLPPPEVNSAVIACRVREIPPVKTDEKMFFRVVRTSFGQRRKTLLNSLKALGLEKEKLVKAFEEAHIDPSRRGETLSLQEFANLTESIKRANAKTGQ